MSDLVSLDNPVSSGAGTIVFIPSGFPVPTETFVHREVTELRRQGLRIVVMPLRPRRRDLDDPVLCDEADRTVYLPFASMRGLGLALLLPLIAPGRALRAAGLVARHLWAHWRTPRNLALSLLVLPKVFAMAAEVRARGAVHVHAHFANLPAFVAMVIAELLGLGYSFSGHAWDLHVGSNRPGLPLVLEGAVFASTCTRHNAETLVSLAPRHAAKIHMHRHGLDLAALDLVPQVDPSGAPRFLAGGSLVAQKGLFVLLDAWRLLVERGVRARCDIVGEGPLEGPLRAAIERLELSDHIRLIGALPHARLMAEIGRSRGFVLPCIRTAEGFVDGIPNILAEAMALRRPVVSSRISGVPELIEPGRSGLLAEPGDAASLAAKIESLDRDPTMARRLGARARATIERMFDVRVNTADLAHLLTRTQGVHVLERPGARGRVDPRRVPLSTGSR